MFSSYLMIINMQLQELKQRASGNLDEAILNPGVSKKQPLHVVMVRYSEIMRGGLNVKDFPFKSTHTLINIKT